jgi:hypothetical protein
MTTVLIVAALWAVGAALVLVFVHGATRTPTPAPERLVRVYAQHGCDIWVRRDKAEGWEK